MGPVSTKITAGYTGDSLRGGLPIIDKLAPEWDDLCSRSHDAEPFFRPEYFRAFVRAFEPDQEIIILTVRYQDKLAAILPLVRTSEFMSGVPVRLLTSPRGSHHPRYDGVCAAEDPARARLALLHTLTHEPGWDVLRVHNAPHGGFSTSLVADAHLVGLRSREVPFHRICYVTLDRWDGGWDWYVAQRSANFRHMVRQAKRRADKQGALTLRRLTEADRAALDKFYATEAAGWKGEAGSAIASDPTLCQFYDDTAQAAERFGYFRLYLLELSGVTIAGLYSFEFNQRLCVPKIGYDEAFRKLAPGHLLVNCVLQDCASRGIREFDFLGPWMEWKAAWTDTARPHSWCFLFQRNLSGTLMYYLNAKVRPGLRKLLRRGQRAKGDL